MFGTQSGMFTLIRPTELFHARATPLNADLKALRIADPMDENADPTRPGSPEKNHTIPSTVLRMPETAPPTVPEIAPHTALHAPDTAAIVPEIRSRTAPITGAPTPA